MNAVILALAGADLGRIVAPSLAPVAVVAILSFLARAARKESVASAGDRIVEYPKAMKLFVWGGWTLTIAAALLAGLADWGADTWWAVLIVALFTLLILPLHLEVFGVRVEWDDTTLYTQSPWRRRRAVPISSIERCDFSTGMMWYRIFSANHGIIRLHLLAKGIPDILAVLPCAHPGYPPNPKALMDRR